MGSRSHLLPLERDFQPKSSPRNDKNNSFQQIHRSRFMILKKIDYLHWIPALAVFIFFLFLFQFFLPIAMVDKADGEFLKEREGDICGVLLKEVGGLDSGEDVEFVPPKRLMIFPSEKSGNGKPPLASAPCSDEHSVKRIGWKILTDGWFSSYVTAVGMLLAFVSSFYRIPQKAFIGHHTVALTLFLVNLGLSWWVLVANEGKFIARIWFLVLDILYFFTLAASPLILLNTLLPDGFIIDSVQTMTYAVVAHFMIVGGYAFERVETLLHALRARISPS